MPDTVYSTQPEDHTPRSEGMHLSAVDQAQAEVSAAGESPSLR
jgi:hypothetical protein